MGGNSGNCLEEQFLFGRNPMAIAMEHQLHDQKCGYFTGS